jgi:hypothetical protein
VNRISRNLSVVYKTESLIARRRFAVVQSQTALMLLAGAMAVLGVVFVNIAVYLVLSERISSAGAAGVLAVGNLVLAALIVSIAGRMSVDREIAPVVELRDLALAELEADINGATREAREVVASVKDLRRDPFGSAVTLIIPLISAALKKK